MTEQQLAQLEQRVAQLEAQVARFQAPFVTQPTTLVTPVQIVTPQGHLVASIEPREQDQSLRFFNAHGQVVAAIGADGTHAGYVAIRNAGGVLVGALDVEIAGARLQLTDHHAQGGVVLFGGDSGEGSGGGININQSLGSISIGLWSTPEGGELTIYAAPSEDVLVTLPAPL